LAFFSQDRIASKTASPFSFDFVVFLSSPYEEMEKALSPFPLGVAASPLIKLQRGFFPQAFLRRSEDSPWGVLWALDYGRSFFSSRQFFTSTLVSPFLSKRMILRSPSSLTFPHICDGNPEY